MVMDKISQKMNNLRWKVNSTWYKKEFNHVDRGFLVKGRCEIRSEGYITVGRNVILDSFREIPISIQVGKDAKLSIGDDVCMNFGTFISCNISIQIGDRCLIAQDVMLLDDDGHPVEWRLRHDYWPEGPDNRLGGPIQIEDNVWISARAIILKNVRIGQNSVIGAGSVVTKDVPSNALVAGVPAKVIKKLG
jgi:acetyltransferase-like isoleucine patch superfamily enzyme